MIKERKYQMTERDVQELFAKILDDLAEKLAARQIQLAQSNTQHKGIFVSVLQIFLKALGEVRTEHYGPREK